MRNATNTATDTTALLAVIKALQQENDYLRLQLAKARRERFGRSSERAGDLLAQLPLSLGDVATAESSAHVVDPHKPLPKKQARPPQRHSLPESLPPEEHVLAANDSRPDGQTSELQS